MVFTKAVAVAENYGKHISLLVVPAGDVFAALVQTAISLEASAVVAGQSNKLTAQEQAYHMGQAWEAQKEPKQQFGFYVVQPNGEALVFHIGPHAPALQADDVQAVHQLWLDMRKNPDMSSLHHCDIVSYALTRLATAYEHDKQGTMDGLRLSIRHGNEPDPEESIAGSSSLPLQQSACSTDKEKRLL